MFVGANNAELFGSVLEAVEIMDRIDLLLEQGIRVDKIIDLAPRMGPATSPSVSLIS